MNTADMKRTLTKKIGPLPAWAWAIAVAGGIWWYRRRTASGATANTATTSTAPVSDAGTILQPGESVVNPDGSISTAPGGGGGADIGTGGGGAATDPNAGLESALQALSDAIGSMGGGQATPPNITINVPKQTAPKKSGNNKRTAKGKHTQTTKPPTHHSKRPRSSATAKSTQGHKPGNPNVKLNPNGGTSRRTVKPGSSAGTRLRQRPTTPAVQHASPTQHPEATHPVARKTPPPPPPPRPSSPPPRTQRRQRVK